jgi:hypothetical protein
MRKHTRARRTLRVLFVVFLVLPFVGIFAQAALAHHSDISVSPDCIQQDGTWDFTYTVTAATSVGADPVDMQNPSVQVWFVWDGATPTSNTPPDFGSIGAVLDQTGAFVWNGEAGVYPSFSGSGTAPAGTSEVTIWAVPTAPWSDGTPAGGSARWAEVFNVGYCQSSATVSVSTGACVWNGESSETPVTVVIDPESGATVTISGPGGPYEFTGTGGSADLAPGGYAWSASASDGYVLTGAASGEFTAGDCPPPPTTTTTSPPYRPHQSITIVKISQGGIGTFSFVSQTLGSFDLTTTQADVPVSTVFNDLSAGTYDVMEGTLAEGWSLTSATCSDGSSPDQIVLSEDEDVTCTFTNSFTQVAAEVVENTTATAPPETLPFTGGSSSGAGGVGIGLLLLGGLILLVLRKETVDG